MSIGPWDFNGFDVIVLVILLISLLMAANRGLMRELTSLLALFISAGVALFVFGQYRFAAQDFISPTWLADGALALGSFALTYMVMVFLLSGLVKTLKGKSVGLFDRLLGAGFGVLRGLIQSQTPLGEWKDRLLKDPMRIMEAYLSCAQAQADPV